LETGESTEWAYVGGRPLAGEFDSQGNLYVCDAVKGLLYVDKETKVVTIAAARTNDGVPILFADDIGIKQLNKRLTLSMSFSII
jgi:sugar lactone lactonase YvrE